MEHLEEYGTKDSLFDILKRYPGNQEIVSLVFSILQYLIRDKPNRIRLTESSLSSIVTCLLTPGTGMQLEYVLAISSFLCTLDIPDDDLPLISSSALLPALFLSSGVQCCEYNSALDIEKEPKRPLFCVSPA